MAEIPLPRFYSDMIAPELLDAVAMNIKQSEGIKNLPQIYSELIQLMDIVVVQCLLQSMQQPDDQQKILDAAAQHFFSQDFLDTLRVPEETRAVISEQIERILTSLLH